MPSGLDLATEEPDAEPVEDEMEVALPSLHASLEQEEAELPSPAVPRAAESFDIDLPAPASRSSNRPAGGELDLSGPAELDLPSRPPASAHHELAAQEIDLPSIPAPADPAAAGEMDLPMVADEVPDLPAMPVERPPRRAAPPSSGGLAVDDLPVVSGELPDLSADLPDLSADLPDLGGGLPDVGGDLPDLNGGLPDLAGQSPDLAAAPPAIGGGLPDLAASPPVVGGGLPDLPGELPLPGPPAGQVPPAFERPPGLPKQPLPDLSSDGGLGEAGPSSARAGLGDPTSFGEVDLGAGDLGASGGPASFGEEPDEFDAFPIEDGPAKRSDQVGGEGYGEVALDSSGGGDLTLDEEPDRGVAPEGPAPAAHAAVDRPGPLGPSTRVLPAEKRRLSRGAKITIGVAAALTAAGGALTFVPTVGPYGAYVVIDALKAEEHAALLASLQREARQAWAADTAEGADRAFARAEALQQRAPRHVGLRAYASFLGFMRQVRFGRDGSTFARAQVLLEGIEGESDADTPHLKLARLAREAANGQFDGAKRARTSDLDGACLAGEAALASGDGQTALKAWSQATKLESSPRTLFGLARAHLMLNQEAEARQAAEKVLAQNARHVGARLLLARLRLDDRAAEEELVRDLEEITAGAGASQGEQVVALNLLGGLHLSRSRFTKAEQSFTRALALQADSLEALRGLGDALFAGGRFSEALTRYEAATKVAPSDLAAQLGVVRAQLSLEQLEDAARLLEQLRKQYPQSTAVAYWFGRAKELVGDRKLALESYRKAVELNEERSELVSAYVGLTRLLSQDGLAEQAAEEIAKARERFPDNPEVYVAIGDLAMAQAQYERAVAEYDRALKLDEQDIGIHFKRGIALRRARSFEEALREFERVAEVDPEFPGLALERGLLYEASGRSEEALREYESALGKAPDDPDLMLRVGCGKASAGQTAAAAELLRKVLARRPNSAETNHCLGKALLLGGGDLREAMRYLERAVTLDGNRAEHHLYVGWAANEAHDPPTAEKALSRALELDQTLADAYWQRGVLRTRQGAVKDAVLDLHRALEMSPSRYEAHAALAEAYFNLGREQDALAHWRKAVTSGPTQPVWHYRYGKLLYDNRQLAEAREQLRQAIAGVEKAEQQPLWLWEAHRLLALSIGRHPDAIPHWQAFLLNASPNSPYRAEALRELKALQP